MDWCGQGSSPPWLILEGVVAGGHGSLGGTDEDRREEFAPVAERRNFPPQLA